MKRIGLEEIDTSTLCDLLRLLPSRTLKENASRAGLTAPDKESLVLKILTSPSKVIKSIAYSIEFHE